MTGELRRAVRTESAAALRHWFASSRTAVNNRRRWAGVAGHCTTLGGVEAQRAASAAGADATRGQELPPDQVERRRETARTLGLRYPDRRAEAGWTADKLKVLGTAPDKVVARRVGRSRNAVRSKRNRLGIPPSHRCRSPSP